MKLIIQYVCQANVIVQDNIIASIDQGYAILVGFGKNDSLTQLEDMAQKIAALRIIPKDDKMTASIKDIKGKILLIPQFTLYADTSKGNRPSFSQAMPPKMAQKMFTQFGNLVKEKSGLKVVNGKFGAKMTVSLTNSGPITISLDN